MRQFIAIPLPEEVINNIEDILEPLRGIKGLKLVRPENLHLTLLFLGDTGTEKRIAELRKIAYKPFTLSTTSVRLYPESKSRLIWIELKKCDELVDLYKEISQVFCVSEGYKAHITLARIKWLSPADKNKVKEEINLISSCNMEFTVSGFNLYSSELESNGPVYQVIEYFPASP